ncbi:bifunctional helix-turn-helix transcriptional regulator/GNAT family N-acetyltransferase [Nocardioides daeguensis]|uniref:Helix-turn-helix domain-containing GNAT family N-acetyltransferase n=1 Tax=Nocardioides daeguensis TaxID=908359 RepID=A0ABP6UQS9_9ACTN|nr:bifunctional helix-turn-helix transcriptional regulator/GNAT family N-acetyltransferase [Nocardioides daeguensis]MBV6729214.1 bifunctional helix-turn-helix transcriptional regulator/GNAT family N-acetyltransferase [Nocardioides daeguensis]MCR1774781.1 bifunctional helix-turn-helix transcriptional regulator/GNAT family N-acetyltransferase [Nocardioides daeguensis]
MIVEVLRGFNRTYTQRIGALDDSFLGTGRPLAVSRLLLEIGRAEGASVRELRDRLDLDSGHLSRMLRRLEGEGLVATEPDAADRRRRVARLTPAGAAAYDDLERRSEERAVALVEPLTPRQQERLAEALRTADLLVRAATVRLTEVRSDHPMAREATRRYVAELAARFPDGFDPGGPDAPEAGSTFVVATSDGEPVAYGGIRPVLDDETAEIKRMWVDAEWRGAGLGARMLRHLETLAAAQGHRRVVLDTNRALHEAIAMYERAGYERVERYNDNPYAEAFFAKTL